MTTLCKRRKLNPDASYWDWLPQKIQVVIQQYADAQVKRDRQKKQCKFCDKDVCKLEQFYSVSQK